MKKNLMLIGLVLLAIFVVNCNKTNNKAIPNDDNAQVGNTVPVEENVSGIIVENRTENEILTGITTFNFSKILNGDLSEFKDIVWENESGNSKMKLATEIRDRPFGEGYAIDGFGFNKEYGYYYWNQFYNNEEKKEHLVYFICLYPPGVEVVTYDGILSYWTDISKVRMAYGYGIEQTNELVDVFYMME